MVELHPLERRLLRALKDGEVATMESLHTRTGLPKASISRAALWLTSKKYLQIHEKEEAFLQLGSEGLRFLEVGFPERRLVEWLFNKKGSMSVEEARNQSGLEETEFNIAMAWANRKKWIQIKRKGGTTQLLVAMIPEKGEDEQFVSFVGTRRLSLKELRASSSKAQTRLSKRPNVLLIDKTIERTYQLTAKGIDLITTVKEIPDEISQLTSEHIKSGSWREFVLRRYNIHAPVQSVWPGKKQPYKRFLDDLKLQLVALGFKEMEGPLVEYAFFNCDALFMPQDHPAREIHDQYYIKDPSHGDLSMYSTIVNHVKATHEGGWLTGSEGWGYKFSIDETHRLLLRSQGTALSARMLVNEALDIPGKYFSFSRCFRPDIVDRTHLNEFNQVEGIVVGSDLTFRDLLGILEMFAIEIAGADEVKFRPDYFPFTEPSVELTAYKDGAGWLEFGGAGMFRQEVTLPLGIEVPVLAWGLGVDRLFMMKAGINDIRDLFTSDLEWLRTQRVT